MPVKISPAIGLALALMLVFYLATTHKKTSLLPLDLKDAPNDSSAEVDTTGVQGLVDHARRQAKDAAKVVGDVGKRVETCHKEKQKLRSEELQRMSNDDQADRQDNVNVIDWEIVTPRDKARRARVAEIVAEGCLSSAQDYSAAAIVYQHGDSSDHYLHAYLWWKKAVELGDPDQKTMMAKGADRYLVSIGYKQLFATQALKPSMNPADCWCLEEVAPDMTDEQRVKYVNRSLKGSLEWVDRLNAQVPNCGPAKICANSLKDPPKGTLPGLW